MSSAPKQHSGSSANLPAQGEEAALFRLDASAADVGSSDSLRANILNWVLNERYDRAIQELRDFDQRPSTYPNFHERVRRYVHHSIDLIYAIKAKRNFPGLKSLTRAKQQELREKFKHHFKELEFILGRIEKVETDLRINDVRSTIYVVRALWMASIAVIALAFLLEIVRGLAQTTGVVADDSLNKATEWLFTFLGM